MHSIAKSKDLRTDFTQKVDVMRRFFDSLTLAQNDSVGKGLAGVQRLLKVAPLYGNIQYIFMKEEVYDFLQE